LQWECISDAATKAIVDYPDNAPNDVSRRKSIEFRPISRRGRLDPLTAIDDCATRAGVGLAGLNER
jgi:hypothetical protein